MTLTKTCEKVTRLDVFLRREMQLSSSLVGRLKWQNALLVNGVPAHTDHMVQPGDVVSVEILEQAEGFPPQELPLAILYEDDACIALDKPAGMLVHPSPQRNEGTLANGVLYYYEKTAQHCAVHPVTRLDRDTFGVVLLAKNAHVHALLCAMLKARQMEKIYHAAVFGAPTADRGSIDFPVYKIGGGSLLRTVDSRGQSALTEYEVLAQHEQTSLLSLHPVTGRTHQLRLHCMAAGFPILGDPQYRSPASAAFSEAAGIAPQQLCAKQLRFTHPLTGEAVCITSKQTVIFP